MTTTWQENEFVIVNKQIGNRITVLPVHRDRRNIRRSKQVQDSPSVYAGDVVTIVVPVVLVTLREGDVKSHYQ